MPKLSFFQLTKIFVAGFIGYALLVSLLSITLAVVFPHYIVRRFDMSIDTFFLMVSWYFGIFGIVATFLMLIGAWAVLRFSRLRGSA